MFVLDHYISYIDKHLQNNKLYTFRVQNILIYTADNDGQNKKNNFKKLSLTAKLCL